MEVWHTKKKKEVSQVQIDDESTCIEAIKLWQEEFIIEKKIRFTAFIRLAQLYLEQKWYLVDIVGAKC